MLNTHASRRLASLAPSALLAVLMLGWLVPGVPVGLAGPPQERLEPRKALPRPDAPPRPLTDRYEHQLTVKFADGVLARLDDRGRLVSRGAADLGPLLDRLAGAADGPVGFRRLIDLPLDELARLEREAAERSGRAQPDLAGMFVVGAPADRLPAITDILHASDLVEFVHFEPLGVLPPGWPEGTTDGCFDLTPFTPNYADRQGYAQAGAGIGIDAAWAYPGGRGEGVTIADCEYGYREGHEDLCGVFAEPGIVVHPTVLTYGWHEHGTAVLGQLVGGDNGYGVTGLVPDARAAFFFEWAVTGRRRVECITAAIAAVGPGDVVLLEMQTFGAGGSYAPAEFDAMVWLVTRMGVDRGVCVVAAAGNGNQNLDGPDYAHYRARGDSGAILVGAGSADGQRNKLVFSTFGSRVNVQGWGERVFTSGYGDFIRVGGDPNQGYTHLFGGTSSASPMVAAAVASLQGISRSAGNGPISPERVRQILIDTGHPQGMGGHIGPLPDLQAAVDALSGPVCPADLDGDGALTLLDFLAFQRAFDAGEPRADFDTDGRLTLFDFLAFQTAFDAGCS